MKVALLIFTLNAEKNGNWEETLKAMDEQNLRVDLKLIVDSESTDLTVEHARKHNWEIYPIQRANFNHGQTRNKLMHHLAHLGYDIAIYCTQDIIPKNCDTLKNLLSFLQNNEIVGAYGKQQSRRNITGLNQWQQDLGYPESNQIKGKEDIPQLKIMTPFFSDALAAWKIKEFIKYGGFPKTHFGEDFLAAAKIILQGGKIGYCANSSCYHEHSEALRYLFWRGYAMGVMHKNNPWLLKNFGKIEKSIKNQKIPLRVLIKLGVKYIGYLTGRYITLKRH